MVLRNATFKNVTLHAFQKNGVDSYKLLGDAGEIVSFGMFIATLERRVKSNTLHSYARALAHFFDYFYEAGYHIAARENRTNIRRDELREIIEGWKDYLTKGVATGNALVEAVARTLPRELVKAKTSNQYHAALKTFLKLSEGFRREGEELGRYGFVMGKYDAQALFEDIGKTLPISGMMKAAMVRSSMLAGVLSGGPEKRGIDLLPLDDLEEDEFDDGNLFPLDSFPAFVNTLRTSRDKAVYCFYAASGCRTSEGLQLLWEDIDIVQQEVRLVDPNTRVNHPSYLYLTPNQRAKLAWKGRVTQETFLIEPFASMFWKYLREYVAKEYIPHGLHQFVFQSLKAPYRGAPYCTSKASSRQGIFKRAQLRTGLPTTIRGPHSLRHAYGTYILNYIPRDDGGYGLELPIVKVLMGHVSIKHTAKYAKHDKDLIRSHIAFGNDAVFGGGPLAMTQIELKVRALLAMAKALGWTGDATQVELA